ncbi:hypothetical protein J6590_049595 [Homalodisca vitripennis]|nr:hypothetical protein J6590_049595 [Homalodisca vitripennis]
MSHWLCEEFTKQDMRESRYSTRQDLNLRSHHRNSTYRRLRPLGYRLTQRSQTLLHGITDGCTLWSVLYAHWPRIEPHMHRPRHSNKCMYRLAQTGNWDTGARRTLCLQSQKIYKGRAHMTYLSMVQLPQYCSAILRQRFFNWSNPCDPTDCVATLATTNLDYHIALPTGLTLSELWTTNGRSLPLINGTHLSITALINYFAITNWQKCSNSGQTGSSSGVASDD